MLRTSGWLQVNSKIEWHAFLFSHGSHHQCAAPLPFTGTPVNTSISDLKGQLQVLGIDNLNEMFDVFEHKNAKGKKRKEGRESAVPSLGRFSFFIRSVMMRHSQNQKYLGTQTTLMSLPQMVRSIRRYPFSRFALEEKNSHMFLPLQTERSVWIQFARAEKSAYNSLEDRAREFYKEFRNLHDVDDLGKHYVILTQKLMPLRVACAGGKILEEDHHDEIVNETALNSNDPKYSKLVFTSKVSKLLALLKNVRDSDPSGTASA